MKVKILKPLRVSEVGKTVQPIGAEFEMSDSGGEVLVRKGFAEEITEDQITAKEVIELINKAETIGDLEEFKSDERKTVIKALEVKTAELSE